MNKKLKWAMCTLIAITILAVVTLKIKSSYSKETFIPMKKESTLQSVDNLTYDVTQNPLFDVNDISKSINDIASSMKSNSKLVLPPGKYFSKHAITLNVADFTEIDLQGEITFDKNVSVAINYSSNKSKLNIRNLTSKVNNNTAIKISSCSNDDIDISFINGFRNGIILQGKNKNGSQYNKISFQWIDSVNALTLIASTNEDWVNENTFMGGRLSGDYGITFTKINKSGSNNYNGNKFYDVGFEGINDMAVILNNSEGNMFISPRMQESLPKGVWIKEDTNCQYNSYLFTNPIYLSHLKLAYASKISGTLLDDEGNVIGSSAEIVNGSPMIFGAIGRYSENSLTTTNPDNSIPYNTHAFVFYKDGKSELTCPLYEKNTAYVDNANFTMKYLYKSLFVLSQKKEVKIEIPNKFKYDGAEFYVSSNSNTNDMVFIDENSKELFRIKGSDGHGTWRIIFSSCSNMWSKVKISVDSYSK